MARMMSTFAPLEMRLSTSVSCLVGEPCASAEMYLAPCAVERLLDRGLVGLPALFLEVRPGDADRHSFAIAAKEVRLTEASKAAPITKVFQ